jgi:23S rRNA (uracil1939-C5)-methyltransferase
MLLHEVQIHVRGLAVGGEFVGEVVKVFNEQDEALLGITTFVPFAVPGETVRVRITERKERYLRGELLEVVTPSPHRVTPECNYFTDCGGCELQHIEYPRQLEIKSQMIQGALRSARVPSRVLDIVSPVLPGDPYHFRRRVQLHIDSSGRLGFYKTKSRTIVSVYSCPVSVPEIEALLPVAQEIAPALKGKINSLMLESDTSNVLAVLTSPYALSQKDQKEVYSVAKKAFRNFLIIVEGKEVSGSGVTALELPLNRAKSLFLKVPGGAFSQVNWQVNLSLIEKVLEHALPASGKVIYDLYAGAGNFTLPLARAGVHVVAVETDPRLVFYGKESARNAGIQKNVTYHEESVERFLKRHALKESDTVIADPPRSGLGGLCNVLSDCSNVIYISCHLPSFVRDIKQLVDKGFEVSVIQPFDMFAQTSYVEILAVLKRCK